MENTEAGSSRCQSRVSGMQSARTWKKCQHKETDKDGRGCHLSTLWPRQVKIAAE